MLLRKRLLLKIWKQGLLRNNINLRIWIYLLWIRMENLLLELILTRTILVMKLLVLIMEQGIMAERFPTKREDLMKNGICF